MANDIRDSLSLLGFDDDQRVENDGRPVWFEELVVITGMTQMGSFYLPVTVHCLEEISSSVMPGGSERVWISRRGVRRSLMEEDQVCSRLADDGWRILEPGETNLLDKIALCKGARRIAGVCGAGLTNIGFMAPGGRVTSFAPSNMSDNFFWGIAANRGLSYREVRCPVDPPSDWAIPWDAPLQINADDALRLLA